MATPVKLSIVGAGSAQFSLSLVKDICLTESLGGSQICFTDTDEQRLEMVSSLAKRYAAEIGRDLPAPAFRRKPWEMPNSSSIQRMSRDMLMSGL